MTSTISAPPAPRTKRCTGPRPRFAQHVTETLEFAAHPGEGGGPGLDVQEHDDITGGADELQPGASGVQLHHQRGMQQWVGDPLSPTPRDADRTPRARLLAHNAAVEAAEAMPKVLKIIHHRKKEFTEAPWTHARKAAHILIDNALRQ